MNVGVVTKIVGKPINTKFGPKQKYSMEIGGDWYDAGWKKPTVVEGTTVEYDFKETTYGRELTSLSPSTKALTMTPVAPAKVSSGSMPRSGSFPVPPLDPSRSIIRQNALRHATSTLDSWCSSEADAAKNGTIESLCDAVIRAARRYEEYISGDSELKEVKEEIAKNA